MSTIGLNLFERLYYKITGDDLKHKHLVTLYSESKIFGNDINDTICTNYYSYLLFTTECGKRFCKINKSKDDIFSDPTRTPLFIKIILPWIQGDMQILLNYMKSVKLEITNDILWDAGDYNSISKGNK